MTANFVFYIYYGIKPTDEYSSPQILKKLLMIT